MLRFLLVAALLSAGATPEGPPPRPLKIIQVSDTHVGRNAPAEDAARLEDFLRQLAAQEGPVDLWAFTGDLTHKGLKSQFEAFQSALKGLPRHARVLLVKGNHDEGQPAVRGEVFEEVLGDPTRAFDLQGYRIVSAPKLTDEGEDGAWLMKTLRAATRPVLLFVHYHPRAEWLDPARSTSLRAVFSGHWHGNQGVRSGDLYSFNTASATLGGWDFSPPVARVVELQGTTIRSRLVPRAPREAATAWSFEDRLLVQVVTAKGIRDELRCVADERIWTLQRRGIYAWETTTESSPPTSLTCTSGAWSSTISVQNAAAAGVRWARPLGRMQYGGGPLSRRDGPSSRPAPASKTTRAARSMPWTWTPARSSGPGASRGTPRAAPRRTAPGSMWAPSTEPSTPWTSRRGHQPGPSTSRTTSRRCSSPTGSAPVRRSATGSSTPATRRAPSS